MQKNFMRTFVHSDVGIDHYFLRRGDGGGGTGSAIFFFLSQTQDLVSGKHFLDHSSRCTIFSFSTLSCA